MEISKALSQIAEIHSHLAKTEVYRGCRPFVVAATGMLAIAGGILQGWCIGDDSIVGFVHYWVAIATLNFAFVAAEIGSNYFSCTTESVRRTTRKVLGQFVPCTAAGMAVTAIAIHQQTDWAVALPGLWAILFGLGIFASRPYLPRAIGWVALFYFVAGLSLLCNVGEDLQVARWGMTLTFGIGQLLSALVLHWNFERTHHA